MNDPYINTTSVPYINQRERFNVSKKSFVPKVDEAVSRAVGFKVLAQDPRLLKIVMKWKKGKPQDSMEPDNFLENPRFVAELKEVLSGKL